MSNFLPYSIIGSVVLTILLNVLPLIFPRASDKAKQKLHDSMRDSIAAAERGERPRVQVFLPWKAMLIGSIILTILVNAVGYFAGGR
jgi:hypothetical protein